MASEPSLRPRPSVTFRCLPHLLEDHAKRSPDAPAILSPGRAPLTYARLYQHIETMKDTLRAMGISRRDRIAVVLPNGPDMAVAILATAASAACVPLNPAYGTEELERYFVALRPRAVITQAGIDSSARRAALLCDVPVIELSTAADAEAGLFTITAGDGHRTADEPVKPDDVALLLLTSGTTSRPKIVPLSHASLCASAYWSAAAVALTASDRCINMMPLFHGHGLTNVVLASLAAGGSVACVHGCDAERFFAWLTTFRPTWYSAVPTMHRAILAQAGNHRPADFRLRFIRSASASLPPHILAELERTFETCVIEAYGMTETASSPIASNPLPPRQRKPGSVGVPVGLDVAIMNEQGTLLPQGRTGQIVVRGASVMMAYDDDPKATEAAFVQGWFKTGDVGFFDSDGYLFLTGRIREMINRGGEKIAPQEVEEVLLEHPAVAEAVTFAVPHATLGEDVASAVVLRGECAATEKDIRQFVIGRIADFKVPRQVLLVEKIPKGPTGKLQRVGLAAKLGFTNSPAVPAPFAAPGTPLESALAKSWATLLSRDRIGIYDDFFVSGGDSLLATRALADIYELTGVEVDISRFFEAPTVNELAQHLEPLTDAARRRTASIIKPAPRENGVMLTSIAQERMWMLHNALPDTPIFNVLYMLRLTSPCDVAVLERSVNEIVRRHEILRTTFVTIDGRPAQLTAPGLTVSLRVDDLHGVQGPKREVVVQQLLQQELLHCFDLAHGPLLRVRLVRLADQQSLLLIAMPGLIQDGWSLGVLINELAVLHDAFAAGTASPLAPLPIQYGDFAHWQRCWRSYPDIAAQLAYWREQLHDPLPATKLALGHSRRARGNLSTKRRKLAIPAKLSDAAKRFSQREGSTLFTTLLAAFKTLIHHYTGEADLRVATHVANRNRPDTDVLIGPLVNTVVLRSSLGGDPSAREVMRRVRATTLAALANQDLPFEEVVAALERERNIEPAALAQYMVWLQNDALRPIVRRGPGLTFEEVDPGTLLPMVTLTTFDITLMLRESPRGLVGTCAYNPFLFGTRAIGRLLGDFQQVLEQIVMQPDRPISEISLSANKRSAR